ncbi:sugar transferase [Clostridium peptidivorans]|uniref:sugar transferase n=1 Tax=Clostridium peptidivorans TaxID=100174 RepID=UPI000BE2D749|nr:sugar transferase [Clostridium peptidivorans]
MQEARLKDVSYVDEQIGLEYNAKEIEYVVEEGTIYNFIKRTMDIILCLIASVIGIPIVLITCIAVVMESKGSPLYKQERLGKNGQSFTLYKIRSMRSDAEKYSGPKWADKNDSRVTKVGNFIRKTRIDEIPQLYNIIRGDMSIVGPRPERPVFTYQFNEEIPGFINRLAVKPGLTGLAQVNGGYESSPREKLKWDLKYIQEKNILMDIKVIFKTALIVFTGNGAR